MEEKDNLKFTKNKYQRERDEFANHFADPKYCRQAWQSVGNMILNRPAVSPLALYDKDGNPTYDFLVEQYAYNKLQDDIRTLSSPLDERQAQDYQPTELELLLQCQVIHARHSTPAATFVRDTVGAKPVDESKQSVTVNDYSRLTDDELEALAAYQAQRDAAASQEDSIVDTDDIGS